MSCNPQADELFLANRNKHVVHAMRVRTDAGTGDVRDVYRGSAQDIPWRQECLLYARLGGTARLLVWMRAKQRFSLLQAGGTESTRMRRRVVRGAPRADAICVVDLRVEWLAGAARPVQF